MGRIRNSVILWGCAVLSISAGHAGAQPVKGTPQALYGPLFVAVQEQKLFPDSKTFADAIALEPVEKTMQAYEQEVKLMGFDLKDFVTRHFRIEAEPASQYQSDKEDICTHIHNLWPVLTRQPADVPAGSSLLPLKYPYVVPGGRFREIYYWDSYFTMLGLRYSGEKQLTRFMVQNFADLIGRYGYVPNGNRSYYLSRSQPPFFSLMVDLLAEEEGERVYAEFLPALRQEYAFWMEGAEQLMAGQNYRRVVRMDDGALLNRYYSDSAMPRDESWREDVATAANAGRKPLEVFRDLRAAAESGWDFSSRWLKNPQDLTTIRTTDIVPVDLNSLIYHLEMVLAQANAIAGNQSEADIYKGKATARKQAMNNHLWNEKAGVYSDYVLSERSLSDGISAASLFPLYFSMSSKMQAKRVAKATSKYLLKEGGVVTTTVQSGQQWDDPNVWAPMQWIAVKGLKNYSQDKLAQDIARNWTNNVLQTYRNSGALKEKYRAYQLGSNAGGGEYPNQDGFGWTNGVMLALLKIYPQLPAEQSCALK